MANGQNGPNSKNLKGNGQGTSGWRVLTVSFVKENCEIIQFSPCAENEKNLRDVLGMINSGLHWQVRKSEK